MNQKDHLREAFSQLAKRSLAIAGACTSEESTKLHLVLPFIGVLGYNYADPFEVCPEHVADFDARHSNKVDFAVLSNGHPMIAVECKKAGAPLEDARGQLRAYYNALPTAKLAILTNGIVFEFFVDSSDPNLMDEEPFLTVDLEAISAAREIPVEILDALLPVTKGQFDPKSIADLAQIHLVKKRLRGRLVQEASNPSDQFCRFLLQEVGLKNIRRATIERYYTSLVKTAFHEALVLPIVKRLQIPAESYGLSVDEPTIDPRIVTTERELAVVSYVRRRLAFLVGDEALFKAIEEIRHKDYIGKLVVYYHRERKGRLFDYVEGNGGFDKFAFPEPYGEITTGNILDIDEALLGIFVTRVRDATAEPHASGQRPFDPAAALTPIAVSAR
ncbi:MAG: type I restriction enzyme HsdR N-terminal domain-containing protein [Hyphomicrobiaceae bacterium]|nr:type I restriction enzyme HsdR N-terminal domain-containing protein [Hyphomicrobiaceae bacterium]